MVVLKWHINAFVLIDLLTHVACECFNTFHQTVVICTTYIILSAIHIYGPIHCILIKGQYTSYLNYIERLL